MTEPEPTAIAFCRNSAQAQCYLSRHLELLAATAFVPPRQSHADPGTTIVQQTFQLQDRNVQLRMATRPSMLEKHIRTMKTNPSIGVAKSKATPQVNNEDIILENAHLAHHPCQDLE